MAAASYVINIATVDGLRDVIRLVQLHLAAVLGMLYHPCTAAECVGGE